MKTLADTSSKNALLYARRRPRRAVVLVVAGLVVVVLTGVQFYAQGQLPPNLPGKWWTNPRIVQQLELTQPQIQKIENIWMERRKQLIDLRSEHEKQQIDLETMVSKPNVDEAALRTRVDQLYKAKAEIEKVTLFMRLKIRDVLTPDQQERSKELFAQFLQDQQDRRQQNDPNLSGPARNPRLRPPVRKPPSS